MKETLHRNQIFKRPYSNFVSGTVDSNDSFNSNLLIEPGQDLSGYPPSSSGSGGPGPLPPHHLPPGAAIADHLQRFSNANPGGGYLVPPRK